MRVEVSRASSLILFWLSGDDNVFVAISYDCFASVEDLRLEMKDILSFSRLLMFRTGFS